MELVAHKDFPSLIQFPGRIFIISVPSGNGSPGFCISQGKLTFSIGFFVLCHGSVGTPVILQIKFSRPHWKFFFPGSTMKPFKKFSCCFQLYLRRSVISLLKTQGSFHHPVCGTSPSVTISVGYKNVFIQLLLLITLPGSLNLGRMSDAVIISGPLCGMFLSSLNLLSIVAVISGSNKMSKDPGSINALPPKAVKRNLVKLVPADLGGHKAFDSTFFHNLRQRS